MKGMSRAVLMFPALLLPLMGLFPALTMDRLADMGQWFFVKEGLSHAVAYFHWENVKGGLCSIGIGLVLYFALVRHGLMAGHVYVDRWPRVLDLENLLYRPILQTALPGIFGTVFGWIDRYVIDVPVKVFLMVSAVLCRGMDHLADGVILLARKTSHRQVREKAPVFERHGEAGWKKTGRLIIESFSFGLMLFCIGLCLTLGYLFYVFLR